METSPDDHEPWLHLMWLPGQAVQGSGFSSDLHMHAKSLLSCPTLCDSMGYSPPVSSAQKDSPGKNTRVGCYCLLQGSFPTQGLTPSLLHLLHCPADSLSLPPGKPLDELTTY